MSMKRNEALKLTLFPEIWSNLRIGEVIDEDVLNARVPFVARTQQCFAVKAGIDGFLDIARRSFCDTSEGAKLVYLNGLNSNTW